MKNLYKYFFFILILGLLSYPSLAQNTDNQQNSEEIEASNEDDVITEDEVIIEDEEFFDDMTDDEIEEYYNDRVASDPWTQNEDDAYLRENISRQNNADKTWKKLSRKLKYDQDKKKKTKRKKDKKDSLNNFTGEGWGEIIRWIFIVLGIIVVLGLIVYLAQGGNFRQGQKINVDISDEKLDWIEENLPEADVQSPLDAAIASKQYRKAIRLYFLLIVQKLTIAGEIDWQKEKTNRTYILETYNKDFHESFRTCVRIYERVWYGERTVNEDEFIKIEPIFKELANRFIIQNPTHAE